MKILVILNLLLFLACLFSFIGGLSSDEGSMTPFTVFFMFSFFFNPIVCFQLGNLEVKWAVIGFFFWIIPFFYLGYRYLQDEVLIGESTTEIDDDANRRTSSTTLYDSSSSYDSQSRSNCPGCGGTGRVVTKYSCEPAYSTMQPAREVPIEWKTCSVCGGSGSG